MQLQVVFQTVQWIILSCHATHLASLPSSSGLAAHSFQRAVLVGLHSQGVKKISITKAVCVQGVVSHHPHTASL